MLGGQRVRIVLSSDIARSPAGQLGAWLCVNLLARLDGLVSAIELDGADATLTHAIDRLRLEPGTQATSLHGALQDLVSAVSAGCVQFSTRDSITSTAVQVVIGRAVLTSIGIPTVWCFGRGWRAFVGRHAMPFEEALTELDTNPLGMYLAVCCAVGEVFKILRGVKPTVRNAVMERVFTSLWEGKNADAWVDLVDGPDPKGLPLPAAYLAGAGAVAQAVALALATCGARPRYVTTMDEQPIDRKNRNRYILAARSHEGVNKAEHLANFLKLHHVPAYGADVHWQPYLSHTEPHPEETHAAAEGQLKFPLILSCVDRNPARHELQRAWPRELLGGSTDGLRALAVHYDMRVDTACLMCHNPIVAFESRLNHVRAALADFEPQMHARVLEDLGFDPGSIASVLQYLQSPQCGELGEAAIKKFSDEGPPAFSVGFVSVAAGLLLLRHWIRMAAAGVEQTTDPSGHYLSLNFFNGRMMWSEQGRRTDCECVSKGRVVWNTLWSERDSTRNRVANAAR